LTLDKTQNKTRFSSTHITEKNLIKKTKLEGIIGIKNLWRKRNRGNTNFALRLLCPIVAMGRKLDRSEAKRETKTLKMKD
jgi:hypothetical protein